jgi:hypothetical protein
VTDKSGELWCDEYDIIEEGYIQIAELRGINAGHEDLQVFGTPLERKMAENREGRTYRGRRTLAFLVRERSSKSKLKAKLFKAGQCGEASDHRLGWNVPGIRDVIKVKMGEVSDRQK